MDICKSRNWIFFHRSPVRTQLVPMSLLTNLERLRIYGQKVHNQVNGNVDWISHRLRNVKRVQCFCIPNTALRFETTLCDCTIAFESYMPWKWIHNQCPKTQQQFHYAISIHDFFCAETPARVLLLLMMLLLFSFRIQLILISHQYKYGFSRSMLTELMGSSRNHVVNVKPFSYGHFASGGNTTPCKETERNAN